MLKNKLYWFLILIVITYLSSRILLSTCNIYTKEANEFLRKDKTILSALKNINIISANGDDLIFINEDDTQNWEQIYFNVNNNEVIGIDTVASKFDNIHLYDTLFPIALNVVKLKINCFRMQNQSEAQVCLNENELFIINLDKSYDSEYYRKFSLW